MKIILRDEISTLGTFGDIVTVADGYARNFLIPKGLALKATPGNLRQFEAEKDAWAKKAAELKHGADKVKEGLEAVTLHFTRKAGEGGKLFGSVTTMDIHDALSEKGIEVDKRKLLLEDPVKTIGEHIVRLKLHSEVTAGVKLVVEPEAGSVSTTAAVEAEAEAEVEAVAAEEPAEGAQEAKAPKGKKAAVKKAEVDEVASVDAGEKEPAKAAKGKKAAVKKKEAQAAEAPSESATEEAKEPAEAAEVASVDAGEETPAKAAKGKKAAVKKKEAQAAEAPSESATEEAKEPAEAAEAAKESKAAEKKEAAETAGPAKEAKTKKRAQETEPKAKE